MKNNNLQGIHYRVGSDRDGNLKRIIIGLEKSLNLVNKYNHITNGGVLDIGSELEFIYGLALVAMQNYINMTCVDCFIIRGFSDKKDLEEFSKEIKKQASRVSNSEYTFVELIYALANAIKHRNDLELQCHRTLMSDNSDNESYIITDSYRGTNLSILNAFNLLTPIREDGCSWEIYPIIKGLQILDKNYNLHRIATNLFEWASQAKWDANNLARNKEE